MIQGTQFNDGDYSFLTNGGLFQRLLMKVGLGKPGIQGLRLRAFCFAAATYLPLLVLAFLQAVAYGPSLKQPFLYDISEATRFLFVGPLLVLSEAILEPWLIMVVAHVRDRLVAEEETPLFERFIKGAAAWRDSYLIEILLFAWIFVWQWIDVHMTVHSVAGTWQTLPASNNPTYAWYWYAYFAKPLVRFLWLRWLWRYLIWSVFLCRLATLKLKLMPTHPDRYGGLAFIAVGHAKFSILALALGAQAASIFGEQILTGTKTLMSFRYEILVVLMVALAIFLTPLLAFTGKLLDAKRIGLFEYGGLADEYCADFRAKWIDRGRGDERLLGTGDIQSLADMGNSYSVVNEMRVCLINKGNLMTFAVATLLPFAPLLLTVYPFDELLRHLLKVVM